MTQTVIFFYEGKSEWREFIRIFASNVITRHYKSKIDEIIFITNTDVLSEQLNDCSKEYFIVADNNNCLADVIVTILQKDDELEHWTNGIFTKRGHITYPRNIKDINLLKDIYWRD